MPGIRRGGFSQLAFRCGKIGCEPFALLTRVIARFVQRLDCQFGFSELVREFASGLERGVSLAGQILNAGVCDGQFAGNSFAFIEGGLAGLSQRSDVLLRLAELGA